MDRWLWNLGWNQAYTHSSIPTDCARQSFRSSNIARNSKGNDSPPSPKLWHVCIRALCPHNCTRAYHHDTVVYNPTPRHSDHLTNLSPQFWHGHITWYKRVQESQQAYSAMVSASVLEFHPKCACCQRFCCCSALKYAGANINGPSCLARFHRRVQDNDKWGPSGG